MTVRFGELLENIAHRRPNDPALTFLGHTRTWGQMYRRCRNVAAALQGLGAVVGTRVAYLGFNSDALFELYYAAPMAGSELVIMNFRWSLPECMAALEDTAPIVLVFDAEHAELAMEAARACPGIRHLVAAAEAGAGGMPYEDLASTDRTPEGRGSGGDDTMIVYFTGGTTGRSKGVMITHNNMFANAMGAPPIMRCDRDRAQIIIGPLFHMAPGSRLYSAVLLNSHTVIMPRFDMVEMMKLIERHRVNAVTMVPTMMHMLLEHPEFANHDLSSLGPIMLGGAPTPRDLLERALEAFPGAQFSNGYGMTEMSNLIAALTPDYHVLDGPKAGKLQSVGHPVPYLDVRVFDADDREVAQGEIGEIVTRGPTVMKGYLNNPDATAEALRGGWFHTGDMGYMDADGMLFISGRAKDMIITGGENVYPTEVEDVLSTHPAVSEVAVIGVPDPKWGEAVHAVIIPASGASPDVETLMAHCRAALAGYKCPKVLHFRSEPMPLSGANKVLKTALRAEYGQKPMH
ncbi:MAG: AMP-binding protein [Pseudomonadota bacterium]